MSSESSAMRDDAPSQWWPCPECGGVEMRAVVLFERGQWTDFEGGYEVLDPPGGLPSSVSTSDVVCDTCGHRFDIAKHYGWLIDNP